MRAKPKPLLTWWQPTVSKLPDREIDRTPAATSPAPARIHASAITGIGLTVAATAAFSVLDAGSKYVGSLVPIFMALWLRYSLQSIFTISFATSRSGTAIFKAKHWRFQLMRGVLFCVSNGCAMMSLRYLPLAEFTAIVAMTPIAMTLVAALWLKQPVSRLRWVLVFVGFAGTLIIIRPGGENFHLGTLLWPMLQLLANTAYQIVSSEMAGKERPETTQIYTSLLAFALTTLMLPWTWTGGMTPALWLGAFCMGLGSAIGHLLMLKAYEYARPATITPFLYSQIPFALCAGWFLYGHIPDQWAVIGMVTIAVGGMLSVWLSVRESR